MARFLCGALPVWALVLAIFASLRARTPAARIGPATALTLARGLLLGALAGFALLPPRGLVAWAPAVLYTAAAVADLFDGYLARRLDEVSALGGQLDVALDALGLVVAPLAAVLLGRLPPWYLLLGAAYYLFQAGVWLRRRLGLPLFPERLAPYPHARMFAGYQMGLVATVLFPLLGPPGTSIAATAFMLPTLALFTRDWLVLSGRIAPQAPRRALALGRAFLGLLLPLLRVAAPAGLVGLVMTGRLNPALLVAAALLLAGILTRLIAFAAAVALTLILPDQGALAMVTFLVILPLLLAGGGRGALWDPEERWLLVRPGTPRRTSP
jgi:CDP-diacylglycerol--glycerol-3-phosphate 3-phosphatidyltransferase